MVGLSFSVDVIRKINGDEVQLDRPAHDRGTLETSMSVRGTKRTNSMGSPQCPLLALSRHRYRPLACLLLRGKRTFHFTVRLCAGACLRSSSRLAGSTEPHAPSGLLTATHLLFSSTVQPLSSTLLAPPSVVSLDTRSRATPHDGRRALCVELPERGEQAKHGLVEFNRGSGSDPSRQGAVEPQQVQG